MEVQLRFAEPNEPPLDPSVLREYGRIIHLKREKKLWPILDVCIDESGRWVLILPPFGGRSLSLSEVASAMDDIETPCSIALSLSEVFMVLHQARYRKGIAFDWDKCMHVIHLDPGGWYLALKPPTPSQFAASRSNRVEFNPRYTAPEQIASFIDQSEGRGVTKAGDSYTIGTILYELLSGRPLFQEDSQAFEAALDSQFSLPAICAPDLSANLNDFVIRALSPAAELRPSLGDWKSVMHSLGGRSLPPPLISGQERTRPAQMTEPKDLVLTSITGKPSVSVRTLQQIGLGASSSDFLATIVDSGSGNELSPGLYGSSSGMMLRSVSSPSAARPVSPPIKSFPPASIPERSPIPGKPTGETLPVKSIPEVTPFSQPPASITENFSNRIPSVPEADPVDCTVLAPPQAGTGSTILVQVFLHTPDQAEAAKQLAQEFDEQSQRLGYYPLEVDLPRRTPVTVELFIPGMDIDDPLIRVVWQGRTTSVVFGVNVPTNTNPGTVLGKVTVYLESVPIGHIKFKLEITIESQTNVVEPQPVGSQAQRYQEAFISYSSRDRDEVLKRVQMLERFKIHVFQDVLALEPGMQWEQELYRHIDSCDLFLLFWSSAAKDSPWVDKEVRYALTRKGSNVEGFPEIIPILIEGPPVPLPPDHLAHLHFNDRLLYFMTPRT